MWSYVGYGAVLGLSAGISPGPLLTLVISQTLTHNAREGVRVAVAPVLTDVPLILLGLFAVTQAGDSRIPLGVLSVAGGVFVTWLGLHSIRQGPVRPGAEEVRPRSLLKGALVNVLSPHPWLFWFSVGVPTMVKAGGAESVAAWSFVGAFLVCIVGSKVVIAQLVSRSRGFLAGSGYLWTMRILGVLLVGFAVMLFHDGVRLLSGAG